MCFGFFCCCCRVCTGSWWRLLMRMIIHPCLQKTLSSLLLSVRYHTDTNMCTNLCIHKLNIRALGTTTTVWRFLCLFVWFPADSSEYCGLYCPGHRCRQRRDHLLYRSDIGGFYSLTLYSLNEGLYIHAITSSLFMFWCVVQPDAEYFKVELPNSGEVILSKPLDYETKTLLTVTIHASVCYVHFQFWHTFI